MILGIGNDLCNINRIEGVLNKFGDRFLAHVFSPDEAQALLARPMAGRAASIAKRFAAKEACAKALGTGIAEGVYLRDLRIGNAANGRPVMELHNGAAQRLAQMTPAGMRAKVDVSLSDEIPMAMAFVIISAVDRDPVELA